MAFGLSVLLPAAPAAAHNSLTGSDPRDGAQVATAPKRIELRFLAKADPATTEITVTGPDNAAAGGPPSVSGSRVSVPFTPGPAGLYTVAYRVTSSDGHPISGKIRFTLTTGRPAESPATPSGAAPGSPTPPVPSATTSTAQTSPGTPIPAARQGTGTGGRQVWLWALAAVVLAGGLAAGLLLRRRSTRR